MLRGLFIGICVLFLIVLPVSAYNIGIFVDSYGDVDYDCVEFSGEATAKEILERSKFNAEYSYGGLFLDSIDGTANNFNNGESWWLYYSDGRRINEAKVGVADLTISREERFVYFGFYEYDENFEVTSEPEEVPFYLACPEGAIALELTGVYTNVGDGDFLDVNDSITYAEPDQEVTLNIRLQSDAEDPELDEKDYDIEGTILFKIADEEFEEDFFLGIDEVDTFSFSFEFPYSEPGFYKGNIYVEGENEFESYEMDREILFGIKSKGQSEVQSPESEVEDPNDQIPPLQNPNESEVESPESEVEDLDDQAPNPKPQTLEVDLTPIILISVLGIILLVLIIILIVVFKK